MILSTEDKEIIKKICMIFNAQALWVDGLQINLPKKS